MTDTTAPRPDDDTPRDTAEQPVVEQRDELVEPEPAPVPTEATAVESTDEPAEATDEPTAEQQPAAPAHDPYAPPPVHASSDSAPQSGDAASTTAAPVAPAAPQVVYVDAPQRPKKRGTRGTGALVVLLATGVFTVLYALATVGLALALRPDGLNGFTEYLASAPFLVPVLVFAGAHLLLVVVANRAGWWMHVLGGFLVAVLVWVAFLGAALIAAGAVGASAAEQQAVVLQQVVNPLGIIAAILAREIPIWVGGIVSRRGRTQAAKNAEAQAAYERDLAAHRASVAPAAPAS